MCVHFHVGELSKTSTNNMVPSFKKKRNTCVRARACVCVCFVRIWLGHCFISLLGTKLGLNKHLLDKSKYTFLEDIC